MAAKRNEHGTPPPNRMMLRRTLFLLVVCGIVAFLVLGVRLYQIQVRDHDYYESMAIEQQTRETKITADRGTVYDRNMNILAMSATAETIYLSPAEIAMYEEDVELIADKLSEILGVSRESVVTKAKDRKSWYKTVAVKVEKEVADQIRVFKTEHNIKGVKIESDTKRYYPLSSLASHVVGFVGIDNYGLNGLEAKYDDVLSGRSGWAARETTSRGTEMLFSSFEDFYDPEKGSDVVLTLDSAVQYYLEKHLKKAVVEYDVLNGAAAIAMDVKTGGILGMVSLGNFDLNNYLDVSDEVKTLIDQASTEEEKADLLYKAQLAQWRNKAVSDTYEPGSTFKIMTLSMALEEGLVNENSHFFCGGTVGVLGRNSPVKCWRSAGHGSQSLAQAVRNSCNVAFVNIGLKVGAEKFYEYVKAFGFFEKTGVDMIGESSSLWWTDEVFKNKDNLSQLAAASFGQTFNITPMQLITAVSAVANGGKLMKPYVVDKTLAEDGSVLSQTEPQMVRQVISEQTSKTVCEILQSVVTEGTGKNAYVAGYNVAGKTGTSEKVAQDAAGGAKEYIVSFIGFAPADDPQVAVLVLLDTPSTSTGIYISGGQMAAPVVGSMMRDILPRMGVTPAYTEDEKAVIDREVPDFTGLDAAAAAALLKESGFTARSFGTAPLITQQLPSPGAMVAAGSEIVLYYDAVPSRNMEIMPDLGGMTYEQARRLLAGYAMYISSEESARSRDADVVVTAQSVKAGESMSYGTVVYVTLSSVDNLGRY